MASQKYIGYVGGLAVAVGVGAAVAVAGQGIAHAETEAASTTSSTSESGGAVSAGPKKPDTEKDSKAEESEDTDTKDTDTKAEDTAEDEDDTAEAKPRDAKPSLTKKLRQSAQQFEAEQVEKLRSVFTPRAIEQDEPETERDHASVEEPAEEVAETRPAPEPKATPEPKLADKPVTLAAEPVPWSPDPFRPDDPTPDEMPAAVLALRNLLVGAAAPEFKPYIREGVEAVYRGSQIVPFVNTVVPAYKIIPALVEAAQGNRVGAQIIINELLKTTGPVSLLYYGYDQIADLANRESEARQLKEQFYSTVWDTVDPFALLHEAGDHGLRG